MWIFFESECWIMIVILKFEITVWKMRISFEVRALVAMSESWYLGERQKSRGVGAWWVYVMVSFRWVSLSILRVKECTKATKKVGIDSHVTAKAQKRILLYEVLCWVIWRQTTNLSWGCLCFVDSRHFQCFFLKNGVCLETFCSSFNKFCVCFTGKMFKHQDKKTNGKEV